MDFLHDETNSDEKDADNRSEEESNDGSNSEEESDSEEEKEEDDYLQRMANKEADTALVLSQLFLPKEKMEKMQAQLTNYLYVDDVDELQSGTHVRWICLKNPEELELKKGAIFCYARYNNHVKETIIDACCMCVCKTYMHRHVQFCFDDCLVFQKIDAKFQQLFDLIDFVR